MRRSANAAVDATVIATQPISSAVTRAGTDGAARRGGPPREPAALGSHDFGHQAVADISLLRLGYQGHDARIGVTGDR